MKKYFLFFIALLFFLSYSCNRKDRINSTEDKIIDSISIDDQYDTDLFNDKEKMELLYSKITNNGDTIAYDEAYNIAAISFNSDKFHYYSQVMATKYDYANAYYNMFIDFRYKGVALEKLSIYYLLKANELGSKKAKNDIKYIFKNKRVPKSDDYFILKDTSKYVKIPSY